MAIAYLNLFEEVCGMKMRFVDVGYVIKWYETKDGGFVYVIEGKNDV